MQKEGSVSKNRSGMISMVFVVISAFFNPIIPWSGVPWLLNLLAFTLDIFNMSAVYIFLFASTFASSIGLVFTITNIRKGTKNGITIVPMIIHLYLLSIATIIVLILLIPIRFYV